ncbi:hypothetical protein BDV96DRAFT_582788 [Lophiotrema nucula]|uniref:Uncharacterized protein n=1 Tax=Lophiotrema nucula TaxID=690887 RepID=A0A6A5YYP7_9PLEO|nr:hypothetical protein BDV96DRAFT_582788 [Lophiotrema nucula]
MARSKPQEECTKASNNSALHNIVPRSAAIMIAKVSLFSVLAFTVAGSPIDAVVGRGDLSTQSVNTYNAICYDITAYTGTGSQPSVADINTIADNLSQIATCAIDRNPPLEGGNWKVSVTMQEVGTARANILWARGDVNPQTYHAEYPCPTIAKRLRQITSACSMLLNTQYIAIWSTIPNCDTKPNGVKWTGQPNNPPVDEGGVAFEIMPRGGPHVPDIQTIGTFPALNFTITGDGIGSPVLRRVGTD